MRAYHFIKIFSPLKLIKGSICSLEYLVASYFLQNFLVDLLITASAELIDLTFLKHNCLLRKRNIVMSRLLNDLFFEISPIVKELMLRGLKFLPS